MSATDSRCAVCNSESMGNMFCSQQCEDEYNEVSERLWEINQEEEEPPHLDDYYKPYRDTVSDTELDDLRREK